jgi:hypothetical protein
MMRRLPLFGSCLLVLACAGCGSLGGDETKPKSRTPVVSAEQIGRFSEGDPARAFLAWFRALQRGNSAAAARYYRSSIGLTPERFARQRGRAVHALDSLGPPRILRITEKGARAVVHVALRKVTIAPNGRVDKEALGSPSFAMMSEDGRWKLASNRFLEVLSGIPSKEVELSPVVVTRKALARLPRGGPARAFMGWFRAIQLKDAAAAVGYYRSSLRLTSEGVARQIRAAENVLKSFVPPRIARVVEKGSRATVYVLFRKRTVVADGSIEVTEPDRAAPFLLRREQDGWKLASNRFLEILSGTPSG